MQKIIHFSVDDVLPSLKFFIENRNSISNIWELKFYKYLQYFHRKYGLIVTLNLFDQARGFNINDISYDIKRDFMEAKDWIYLSFHGRESDKEFYISDRLDEFEESYENIEHFSNYIQERNLSDVVRLHYFEADKKRIDFLKKKGVKVLLTADDNRNSYNLSKKVCEEIEYKHSIEIDGIKYVHSDYRIENIKNYEKAISEMKKKEKIILFTHEWCFAENIKVLDKILDKLTNKYNYKLCESSGLIN